MLPRNASISARSISASRRSAPEAPSTSPAADPASAEAVLTPTILLDTSLVPPAACWMLRAISRVAAPCCFDRGRDRGGHVVDLADGAADAADRGDRRRRYRLHAGDLRTNFVGGLRGLAGEALDFGGDHRKAAAGFTGAGGLDGGIERKQIGLRGDGLNQIDHDADAARIVGQTLHGGVGGAGLVDRLARDLRRSDDLAADLGDR